MGVCSDRSVNYLKSLNLNTILQPEENLAPLALLGEFDGARGIIGRLDQLVDQGTAPLPTIESGVAANINGQRTSKLPISLGLNIVGNIIGAMGGNAGIQAGYTAARKVELSFTDVTRDRANVIQIGDYLQAGDIRWEHVILKKYLFGKGKLYVLTEVVKSPKFGVTAYKKDDASIAIDVPVISQIVGGNVKVGKETESSTTVSYEGQKALAFGFAAIELAAGERGDDGELDLVFRPTKAGAVSFSLTGAGATYAEFEGALPDLGHMEP
jgi:hypothetical protein